MMADSATTTMSQTMPSTSSFSNLITAEIRVENIPSSSSSGNGGNGGGSSSQETAQITVPSSTVPLQQQQQQIQTADADNKNSDFDEPQKKKLKFDNPMSKVNKKIEKLENRLGGILCCAVCLDLPKTAMYQVSATIYFSRLTPGILSFFPHLSFCTFERGIRKS